ncbi:MAG: aspartate carbamoyltransferase catalytic subunit [Proteobacteria bacterium]|nr:aspartate carbamoyltransferase catalytic subunit [Pseudomonadota bacterium]
MERKPFPHAHILGIHPLTSEDIAYILELGAHYAVVNRSHQKRTDRLKGKLIVNMFFENSTRTRCSFEVAAKRLGADVVNFSTATSSMQKGETYSDTLRVINAMQVDGFIIRHAENGAVQRAASIVDGPVLNAGDGSNEHPTQALLDALTMIRHKNKLDGLKVAICGDIKHSRVARSNALLLNKMGASVFFFAPPPFRLDDTSDLCIVECESMDKALQDADVVMMLRIQNERLAHGEFAMTSEAYHKAYGLTHERLKSAKPDVIVMHPAPMNRGVEITDELADDPRHSVIFEQMEMGVAIRMACLDLLIGGEKP